MGDNVREKMPVESAEAEIVSRLFILRKQFMTECNVERSSGDLTLKDCRPRI
jgi:hypothetical protein